MLCEVFNEFIHQIIREQSKSIALFILAIVGRQLYKHTITYIFLPIAPRTEICIRKTDDGLRKPKPIVSLLLGFKYSINCPAFVRKIVCC